MDEHISWSILERLSNREKMVLHFNLAQREKALTAYRDKYDIPPERRVELASDLEILRKARSKIDRLIEELHQAGELD